MEPCGTPCSIFVHFLQKFVQIRQVRQVRRIR